MRKLCPRVLAVGGTILASFLATCTNSQWTLESHNKGGGVALLKISISPSTPFKRIAKTAILAVSAPDMLQMTDSLTITDTSVEGAVKKIPSGKHRLFEVSVFDSLEKLRYGGSVDTDVVADSTVALTININRITGNALINGQIIDTTDAPALDPNLLAYWSFDSSSANTYFDVMDHGYDAGSPGLSLVPGVKGKALSCPGKGYELVVLNSRDSFNLKKFTVETWFYSNTDPTLINTGVYILNQQFIASGVYNGWGFYINNSGKADFGMASSGGSSYYESTSRNALKAKTWYHIAGVFDSVSLKLYLNGVLESSLPYSGGTYPPSTTNARIACQTLQDGTTRCFLDGRLDELKLFRYALSADTIKAHYDALKPQ